LGTLADDQPQSSYTVLAFPSKHVPREYQNLIFSSWKRSLRKGNDFFQLIPGDIFHAHYQRFIEHLLSRNGIVRLAVLTDDVDVVLGWSFHEQHTLHYVYVQRDFRRQGIAKRLVAAPVLTITHLTNLGLQIWPQKLKSATFNPFFQGE
jgi:GNAT superfamily N-acetyltransferase